MNVEIGAEAALLLEKEYINGNGIFVTVWSSLPMEEREKVSKLAVITGLSGKISFFCRFSEIHFAISRKK
jgi:hypothetical protein